MNEKENSKLTAALFGKLGADDNDEPIEVISRQEYDSDIEAIAEEMNEVMDTVERLDDRLTRVLKIMEQLVEYLIEKELE